MKSICNAKAEIATFIFKTLIHKYSRTVLSNITVFKDCYISNAGSQLSWKGIVTSRVQSELGCYTPLKVASPNSEQLMHTGRNKPLLYALAIRAYWRTSASKSKIKSAVVVMVQIKDHSRNSPDKPKVTAEDKQPFLVNVQVPNATKWDLFLKRPVFDILDIKKFSVKVGKLPTYNAKI